MDFSVDPTYTKNEKSMDQLIINVEKGLKSSFGLEKIYGTKLTDGVMVMYTGKLKCLLTVRVYEPNNVLTITAEYEQENPKAPLMTLKVQIIYIFIYNI